MAPKQTSRKGTSRVLGYRNWQQTARTFGRVRRVRRVRPALRPHCRARMLPRRVESAGCRLGKAGQHEQHYGDACHSRAPATATPAASRALALSGRVRRRLFVRRLRRAHHFRAGVVRGRLRARCHAAGGQIASRMLRDLALRVREPAALLTLQRRHVIDRSGPCRSVGRRAHRSKRKVEAQLTRWLRREVARTRAGTFKHAFDPM